MNPKALIPLIAGLGIAGLAAKLGFDHLQSARGATPKMVQLWTPVQDIPRGTAISEQMIQPLNYPVEVAPKDALAKKEKLVGRVPHTYAPAGLPILDSMLLPPGAQPGIYVPPGLRAVAVKIDESSGVDNHLQPGCRVDVVGYFNTRRSNKSEIIARTLIENCEVAAVGARLAPEGPEKPAADGKRGSSSKERPARAVTLLVKPDQVPTLHLAEQRGKIKLSMRSTGTAPLDDDDSFAGTATESDVLGESEDKPASNPLSDLVSNLFGAFKSNTPEPAAEPPAVATPEPLPPPVAWTMVVYNGDARLVLGWDALDSMQPRELTLEGPNVFQQQPTGPRGPVAPPQLPPGPPEPPTTEDPPGADETLQDEPEPQELFE